MPGYQAQEGADDATAAGRAMRMNIRTLVDQYALSAAAYSVVAGVSALAEWSTFFVLTKVLNVFAAAAAGFVVATFVNYVLSRGVAFKSKRSASGDLVLVFALSTVAFMLNLGAFTILYAIIGLGPMIAKVAGTGVGFVFNYGF